MSSEEIDDSTAPLVEHLIELRTRLIRSLLAFIVAMVACYGVAAPIFDFLTRPICHALANLGQDCSLSMIKLQEGFFVAIRISFLGGFMLAFPYIGLQLWRFVAPGLYKTEKSAFLPFLVASPGMFLLGAAFAYYAILPLAFDFFLGFQQQGAGGTGAADKAGVAFLGSIEEYLSLTIKFILAFGLCFQLPVLLTLMGKAGLVSRAGLAGVRKYAVVAILMLAAVATPPDVISQVILFVVVYGLYEVSILLVGRVEKQREAKLRAEGLWFEDEDEDEDGAGAEAGAAPDATPATPPAKAPEA
ncbi:MAG: twin-arginine translocase subunit TatC [Alphaproteobacteria bacterium HGW-Alphaproteobacteria-6]|nr:MAG: twin-arginine translocase subunit TatC [Alphaproteobacteria bacterium HGW-Alphaproteobacteria-6]